MPLAITSVLAMLTLAAGPNSEAMIAPETAAVMSWPRRPISIRADITNQHGIFVQAKINGSRPLWFLVDSAAGYPWILDSQRASELRLALGGKGAGWGTGEDPVDLAFASGASVSVGGCELNHQTLAATSLQELQRYAGRQLDGILGYELFNHYVVEIEYASGTINLYDPVGYQYSGPGKSIPVALENNHFLAKTRIILWGESVEGRFLVDTGAGEIAAALTRPFVDSNKLLMVMRGRIPSRLHAGLGGLTRSLTGRAQSVQIGPVLLRDVLVDLSRDATGLLASSRFDGVIGGELLRRFKVIFDQSHQRIILEPNPHLPASFEVPVGG